MRRALARLWRRLRAPASPARTFAQVLARTLDGEDRATLRLATLERSLGPTVGAEWKRTPSAVSCALATKE